MLPKKGFFRKQLIVFFLFSARSLFATDFAFPFIENNGQLPSNIQAKVNLPGGRLFIEEGLFTYHFFDQQKLAAIHEVRANDKVIKTHAFQVVFKNANKNIASTLKTKSKFYANYYIGKEKNKWAENVYQYQMLLQENIYENIDLKMYSNDGNLKYDFIVKANADPQKIKLLYKGADKMYVSNGNLYVQTSVNTITEQKPFAYQIIDDQKIEVACNYKLRNNTLSFEFPNGYDKNLDLVIDPTLIFSTYSGSTANNFGYTATYDDFGYLYAGSTAFGVGYPTTLGAYQINFAGGTGSGGTDIAITRYDTSGTIALYSTYLGGSMDELPHSMIVNSANELFLFGTSGSDDYPITSNAYQTNFKGGPTFLPTGIGISYPDGCDLVVSRLSANGGNLLASTYIGGTENDGLNIANKLKFNYADEVRGEIDIDKNNNIYLASCTRSADFPIIGGVHPTLDSLQEGIIIKMDNQLSNIIWSTFLGGKGADAIYSLALDNDDNIYVTGGTTSDDFPTTANALYPNYLDSIRADAFVSHISNDGKQLLSSTYFGSNEYDQAYFVEIDKAQNVYLLGQTKASGSTLIYQANYSIPGGGEFISKLSKDLAVLLQSTVVGANTGKPNVSPTAFLVDVCNKIYVSGWGSSIGTGNAGTTFNLPVTPNAFDTTTDGNDFYLMVLDENMSNLIYATYFGGNQATEHVDGGTSRFDKKGIVYQCVCAGCGGFSDFPTTLNAVSTTNNATSGSQCNSAVFKFNFDFPMTIADFSAPWVGCDTTISFQNLSSSPLANTFYFWDFGDGNTSTQEHPIHTYNQNGIYDVTLISSDPSSCNISDTIIKQVYILSNSSTTIDTIQICKNEQVQIGLLPVNDPTISYFWFPSYGLSSVSASNPFVNTDSTINYQLLISNGSCNDTLFQLVKVNEIDVEAGNDTAICNNPVLLSAKSNSPSAEFLWASNSYFNDTLGLDSSLLVNNPQFYFVKVTDGTCEAMDSVQLKTQNIDIVLSGDFSICIGDSAFVKVNNLLALVPLIKYDWNPNFDFNFSPDSSAVWFFPDSTLWLFVEVQNQDGCKLQDSVSIAVNTYPIIDSIWASKNPIYKGETTTLNIQTNDNVLWNMGDTNSQIQVAPFTDSLFHVEVYSNADCRITDSIFIQILDVFCDEDKILIPTAFTPNNLPPNNTYRIIDTDDIITSFKLEIFNRFGQKVYASSNKFGEWDGTFKNELLAPQVFDFYIELECIGEKKLFKKGNITLIR